MPRPHHTECRANCIHFPSHLLCKLPAVTKINTTWQACTYPSHHRHVHRGAFPTHTEQIREQTHSSLLTSFIPSEGPRPHYALGLSKSWKATSTPITLHQRRNPKHGNSRETPGELPASGQAQHPALPLRLCCPAPGTVLTSAGTGAIHTHQSLGGLSWVHTQPGHILKYHAMHVSHWGPQLK